MTNSVDSLCEAICNLNLVECASLVEKLNDKFGGVLQLGAAPAVAGGGASADGAAAAGDASKTEFDLVYVAKESTIGNKIALIKYVKEKFSLSLPDSKALVDSFADGQPINKSPLPKAKAEEIQKDMESDHGIKVSLK